MVQESTAAAAKRPSIYLPEEIYLDMLEQARRYGISVAKCAQDAWRIARCYDGPLPDGVALYRDGAPKGVAKGKRGRRKAQ